MVITSKSLVLISGKLKVAALSTVIRATAM